MARPVSADLKGEPFSPVSDGPESALLSVRHTDALTAPDVSGSRLRVLTLPQLIIRTSDQIESGVEEAVREGRRLVVTSLGHCLEGFVSDPEVQVIIDVSPMKGVYYDPQMRAVAVEAGATVGETFRALFEMWGVVIPLGEYPGVGIGGHVVGGAFGFLCRQLGLALIICMPSRWSRWTKEGASARL